MSLFVGRLFQPIREKELDEVFSKYGKINRCELKASYAFITFDDERDAEEAKEKMHNANIQGNRISVEWTRDSGRQHENPPRDPNKCYFCGDPHDSRECPLSRRSRRDDNRYKRFPNRRPRRYRSYSRSRSRSRSRSYSPRRRRSRSRSRSPRYY